MIRPVEGLLCALLLPSLFVTHDTANADTHVANGFRLHVGQEELKTLARAFGEEIGKKTIQGAYEQVASDDLGFTQVTAEGITFTATVARVDSLIGGHTDAGQYNAAQNSALATKVVLGSLQIAIDTLSLNDSGSIVCNDVTITAVAPLDLTMDIVPLIEDHVLHMHPTNVEMDEDGQFRASQPSSCRTPWGFNWLVKQIAPWLAGKLRVRLATAVASEIVRAIDRQTALISEETSVRFALPWKTEPAPAFSASARIWPNTVAVQTKGLSSDRTLTLDFGTDLSLVMGEKSDEPKGEIKGQSGPALWDGWIGASEQLVTGVISEAVNADLLSVILSKQTAPGLHEKLSARELGRFIPDAATRFHGDEEVEIRLGQADAVSVIFKPNGPGGIPIIDAMLQHVPMDIKVDGIPYVSATSTMRYSYLTATDTAKGTLLFSFAESLHAVQHITWSADLYPRPNDHTVTTSGFNRWLADLAEESHAAKARPFGIALPDIRIGNYKVRWQAAVSVRDGYLAIPVSLTRKPTSH